ncbi:hypothetical protein RHSIM_Rhsim05G0178200 [Rhododendron simsii]|uniref:MATH domain-containing protein n=1 Tax=Rhododendron simsii TaxID=118357 RepID=A0A834GVK9_RHOSS|nr:hypothetical protein RHSIM_Rhsim05G0178200 [Rhododendron simsii]
MSLATPTDPSALFTWKIENCSKLKAEKLYSQIFYCGGFKWRLIAYPMGNPTDLSVYLDIPDSMKLPPGWSRYTRFSISLINQIHTRNTKSNVRLLLVEKAVVVGFPAVAVVVDPGTADTEHEFSAGKMSWGFHSFLPLVKLYDPMEGFLVNDTIVLEAGVTIPNSHDSKKETSFELEKKKRKKETGKVRFLSYWVSSEALLVLEKIHSVHEGTYFKFSMKGQALPAMLLESFAAFMASMSSTKVNELNEEALRLAANSIEDFKQVGLDMRWLKQRLEQAKGVKKHSESVNTVEACTSALEMARATVESCTSALEVARAKVCELEEGLAKAKAEGEVMSRELPKPLGVNDSVLKDIV